MYKITIPAGSVSAGDFIHIKNGVLIIIKAK